MNAAHLSPNVARIFAHSIRLPPEQRIARLVEEGRAEVDRSLKPIEERLTGRDYLIDRFTIADVAIAPTLANAAMLSIDLARFPRVAAWLARIGERKAWRKVYG